MKEVTDDTQIPLVLARLARCIEDVNCVRRKAIFCHLACELMRMEGAVCLPPSYAMT